MNGLLYKIIVSISVLFITIGGVIFITAYYNRVTLEPPEMLICSNHNPYHIACGFEEAWTKTNSYACRGWHWAYMIKMKDETWFEENLR